MIITLKNNLHSTQVRLNATDHRLSVGQVQRARRELCGIKDCTCGDFLGARGPDGHDGCAIEDNGDGTAQF